MAINTTTDLNVVGTSQLVDESVTTDKLGALAVTAAKIDTGAVTETKIAADAVTAAKIATGAVGASELASASVGTAKIDSGAATSVQFLKASGSGGASFASVEGTAIASTSATVGHFLKAGAGGTTTVWSAVEGTAIISTSATAGYVLTAGTGGTATTWQPLPASGSFWVDFTGTKAGTALGITSAAYEVRNVGGGVTSVTVGGVARSIPQYASIKITATSELTDFGVASPFTMGTTTLDSTGTALALATASAAVYNNGLYLVGGFTQNAVFSTDGSSWTKFTNIDVVNSRLLEEFAYGNGNYVAATSAAGSVYKSTSGTAGWTAVSAAFSSPASSQTRSVLYGGGTWVVVGDNGALSTSTDLVTFTQQTSGITGQRFNQIAYSGSLWVVVGGNPSLITSSDATTWTTRTSGFSGEIRGVAYGNGLFVAVGDTGGLITSTDGITWTARTSQFSTTRIWNVVYTGTRWFAVGETGKMSTSTDGTTWTSETSGFGATGNIQAIAYGGGRLFGAAGYAAGTPTIGTKALMTSAVFNPITYTDLG